MNYSELPQNIWNILNSPNIIVKYSEFCQLLWNTFIIVKYYDMEKIINQLLLFFELNVTLHSQNSVLKVRGIF